MQKRRIWGREREKRKRRNGGTKPEAKKKEGKEK